MMLLIRCDIFFLCVIYEGKLFEFAYVHKLHSRMRYMTRNSAKLFEMDPNG